MKQITIIIILSFFMGQSVFGQSKIYYNHEWETTTKENANFYRIITKKNDSLFYVKDYYINNVLQMDGHYSNLEDEIIEGNVNFYNKNGKITETKTYSKGVLNGLTTVYLNNGKIDYTTEFRDGEVYNGIEKGVVVNRYYKNGKIIKDVEHNPPNQYYILKTTIYGKEIDTIYWRTAKEKELGYGTFKDRKPINGLNVLNLLNNTVYIYYKNGIREGVQKLFDSRGKLIANMTYKNDQLIIDENLNPLTHKMVTCTYKDNEPFEGSYFIHKPMYNSYTEYIFKNGKLVTKNVYTEVKNGKLTLTTTENFNKKD